MNTEHALKEAMAQHVANVHASPMMGRSVRRRSRRATIRLRTAGAALVTATAAVAVPVTMSLTSGPPVSVAATPTPEATDILPAPVTPEPVTTPFVVEGVSVGYLPQGCDTPGECGVWVGVYKDGATTLDQDGRLDGKKVAENTYLNDGNMIARVLDDTHGVLVVLEPSVAEKLDAATLEAELIKVAEGLTLAG
ncbi:hypothetical protein Aple_011800 [Acrocarpospora pleiomorpha]|uniref:Uncharacterized protein n=1 Tax=Acrocarpospora pleiomorpha TaxID=90975 RepID=A0A5M3X983_9ACTN|nr:hypothetical protein [Acrocarpospora pleiomorpha]GES18285.1 hypothetical protein Aple_011800 [Acrocarpospora pleiomorpha]